MNEYIIELTNGKKTPFQMSPSRKLFALLREPETRIIWNHDHTHYIMAHAILNFRVLVEVEKEGIS